jgi:hypothetical protein
MPTREIPPEAWHEFLDRFSRQHEGWLVTLEVLGRLGAQPEARELPLRGISARSHGRHREISVVIGEAPEASLTHIVAAPRHLRLDQTEEGADRALQIESEDGETTLLQFRSAALPETVDGILPRS